MIENAKVSSSVSSNGSIHVHVHMYESNERIKELEAEVKSLKAKEKNADFASMFVKQFVSSKITMSIDEFVKILESAGVHTGRNKVLETLRNEGYLEYDSNKKNQPTSKSTGLFEFKKNAKKSTILMLTAKGVIDLYDRFTKEK